MAACRPALLLLVCRRSPTALATHLWQLPVIHSATPPSAAACRADLLELARPGSAAARMRTSQRMLRSYAIFQQF